MKKIWFKILNLFEDSDIKYWRQMDEILAQKDEFKLEIKNMNNREKEILAKFTNQEMINYLILNLETYLEDNIFNEEQTDDLYRNLSKLYDFKKCISAYAVNKLNGLDIQNNCYATP